MFVFIFYLMSNVLAFYLIFNDFCLFPVVILFMATALYLNGKFWHLGTYF